MGIANVEENELLEYDFPLCHQEDCNKDWTPREIPIGGGMIADLFQAPCKKCEKNPNKENHER